MIRKVKHARKAIVFMIILVTPLLLAGVLPTAINDEVKATISPITTKVSVPSYEDMTPILAYNDFDMDNYASALEWDGDGSPGDPYIIEGYNITSNGDSILIHDTTRAFEIRNCLITSFTSGAGNGILIDNATQAAIVNTVIMDKSDTLILQNTPSLYIENCTIYDGGSSIDIYNCTGVTITECVIYDNYDNGIYLNECNNSMISNNVINGTTFGAGIRLIDSHVATIIGNHIFNCAASGVWAISSHNATIENNIIHDNMFFTGPECGIHLSTSPYASVVRNEIYDNARNGIYVVESDWVYIFDNHIYGNSDHGIDVMFSINGTIIQNNIHGNGWWPQMTNELCGIYLGPTINFTISDNMIWNNTPAGISLWDAELVTISNNDIFNNTHTGIYGYVGELSGNAIIRNNQIHGNGYTETIPLFIGGIYLERYEYSTIENNHVYNNTDNGISMHGSFNTIVGNTVHDNLLFGISSEENYENIITDNIVYRNEVGIYIINVGTNVTHNIVYDNEYGIYMDWSGDCLIYGNDVGWNDVNAIETNTFGGQPLLWYNNVTDVGNWWHDYNGGGIYWIWNGTHGVSSDLYPSISLNLTQASPITFEILETGIVEWEAYALNPSHYELFIDGSFVMEAPWDGEYIAINVDSLSHGTHTIGIEVFHISGHSLENGTTADVEDLTAPSDIEGPMHITITVGENVTAQYSAYDPSGISEWIVNDTVYFAIDSMGHLISIADLAVGEYAVRIMALDPYGHSTFYVVTITVVAAAGMPTELILAIGAVGAIVILIVGAIVYKTKRG